jgi:hypothetical protein
MKSTLAAITTAARSAIALGLLTVAGVAGATNNGSTDIWSNQFRESFGAPALSEEPTRTAASRNGSTDIWGNQFRQSFGASQAGAPAQSACGTGSTDIWGNGFRPSIGGAPLSAPAQLVAMCGPLRP